MIKKINYLFVTFFGIGTVRYGPGTITSLITAIFLYSLFHIINIMKENDKKLLMTSRKPITEIDLNLEDLKSRLNNFTTLGIEMPTDDLLRAIITKSFSDKQIKVNVRVLEFILKNIDRSYEKIFKFISDLDIASLSAGKSININLVKKILKNE